MEEVAVTGCGAVFSRPNDQRIMEKSMGKGEGKTDDSG